MNFTKELPTRDGYFLWRMDAGGAVLMVDVWRGKDGILYADSYKSYAETVAAFGGEWCRLVPAEEVPTAIVAAYEEAVELSVRGIPPIICRAILTEKIRRAERVMEGME